jgi:uncharacterized protein (DUF2147 family)
MGLLLAAGAADAHADSKSPVGYWKTIDDDGKTEKSIVQIYKKGNKLSGKIIELINPDEPNPLCTECSGARFNKPVIGMVIMWDLEQDDDEWGDGRILDPDNGEEYGCTIKVVGGGKKLDVRGYIGFSLFGRTQTWLRVPAPAPKAAAEPAEPAPEPAEPAPEPAKPNAADE